MKKTQKKFNDLVYNSLKESRTFSLNVLFEENDKEKEEDLFAMDDEPSGDIESEDNSSEELDDSETSDLDSDSDKSDEDDINDDEIELHNTQKAIEQLDQILKLRALTPGNTVASITSESYIRNSSINKFLVVEKDDPDEFVSDLKKAVDKNEDLINTIKKQKSELESGTEVSVENEVRIAIDKLIHFKEKVDIIDLIEELFINKIKLIAPAEKIDSTIEEFIDLYRDEVHKNRAKIDIPGSKHYNDEEVYLDKGNDYNGAAGAKSQG